MTMTVLAATVLRPLRFQFAYPPDLDHSQSVAATVEQRSTGRSVAANVTRLASKAGGYELAIAIPAACYGETADVLRISLRSGGRHYGADIAIGPDRVSGAIDMYNSCRIIGWCSILAAHAPVDPALLQLSIDGVLQTVKPVIGARPDLTAVSLQGGRDGFVFRMPPCLFDGQPHDLALSYAGRPLGAKSSRFLFGFELLELKRDTDWLRGRARLTGNVMPNLQLALVSQTRLFSIARLTTLETAGEVAFDFEVPGATDRVLAGTAIAPNAMLDVRLFELSAHAAFSRQSDALRRLSGMVRTMQGLSSADRRVLHDTVILPAFASARQAAADQKFERRHLSGEGLERAVTMRPLVVVPVYDGLSATKDCLASLAAAATLDDGDICVVADCPPDPALLEYLRTFCPAHGMTLVENAINLGFVGTCNAAIAAAPGRDIVLLNADTIVPHGWLGRLAAAARSAPDIASATPFSNNATILSYPVPHAVNALDTATVVDLDRRFARLNAGLTIDIPTGIGFCMYLRGAALDDVGSFDTIWGAGYGEENDWCMRASDRGWRHVAAADLYVGHVGGASFGSSMPQRMAENTIILRHRYPDYQRLVDDFVAADPLWRVRAVVDLDRLKSSPKTTVLHVDHGLGGGVAVHIDRLIERLRDAGVRSLRVTPRREPAEEAGIRIVCDDPEIEITIPVLAEGEMLARILDCGVTDIHVHGFLNHRPAFVKRLLDSGVPVAVTLHDYAAICPRVTLIDGTGRYCGEPALSACEACVAGNGPHSLIEHYHGNFGSVAQWRTYTSGLLQRARQVLAPSQDCARRIRQHCEAINAGVVGGLDHRCNVQLRAPRTTRRLRIGILGAIGSNKGLAEIMALVAVASARQTEVDFLVIGHTTDDAALLACAAGAATVSISGPYAPKDAVALLTAADLDIGLLLSLAPETHSYTLSEYWAAGVPVLAYDIGAPAERIRSTGGGVLVPLATTADRLLDCVLAAIRDGLAHLPVEFIEPPPPITPLSCYTFGSNGAVVRPDQ